MQATLPPDSTEASRPTRTKCGATARGAARRRRAIVCERDRLDATLSCRRPPADVIGGYRSDRGVDRWVVCERGENGSLLVIDEEATTGADPRLVAHLLPEEPAANAKVVCELYLAEAPERRFCRQVRDEDLRCAPADELEALASEDPSHGSCRSLAGRAGERFDLELLPGEPALELRWLRRKEQESPSTASAKDGETDRSERTASRGAGEGEPSTTQDGESEAVSVREVVGCVESYEPVRAMTAQAILAHRDARDVSVAIISAELARLNASRVVLNRGLREGVLSAVRRGAVSMSEIALRCGRMKRGRHGDVSGETTWLARRLGLAADGRGAGLSPWVHSDVLALIAREGLGVSPREVELA